MKLTREKIDAGRTVRDGGFRGEQGKLDKMKPDDKDEYNFKFSTGRLTALGIVWIAWVFTVWGMAIGAPDGSEVDKTAVILFIGWTVFSVGAVWGAALFVARPTVENKAEEPQG